MVPPPLLEEYVEPLETDPALAGWVRGTLLGIALGLLTVFGLALWINPYGKAGQAKQMETHLQLGLPPCTFKMMSGLPCPSCGMTTSFALLVRGDVWNSLRANWVGTLLAAFCLTLIPWSLASAVCKRPIFIVSVERTLIKIVVVFVVLMLLRWGIVVALSW